MVENIESISAIQRMYKTKHKCNGEMHYNAESVKDVIAAIEKDRDAYKKAKQENDERFMNERDKARKERDELKCALSTANVLHKIDIDRVRCEYAHELVKWVKGHYWDSLEKDKDMILRHLRTFVGDEAIQAPQKAVQ